MTRDASRAAPVDFAGWRAAAGSAIGVAFGSTPFFSAAFALLGAALRGAFGWSARELSIAATLFLATQTLAFPIAGWLLDRLSPRRVACASIVLFGLLLLVLSRMDGSLAVFYTLIALLGLSSAATNFIAYARVLSTWFDWHRGLAIGLTASAQAIGLVSIPLVTQRLIEASGWSRPLLVLGCFELLVCLPAVWVLVQQRPAPPETLVSAPDRQALFAAAPGLADVLRSSVFWRILGCISLEGLTIYAIVPNTVFILGHIARLGTSDIAGIVSLSGAAFFGGRIVFGYLLDRLQARWLFLLLLSLLAAGLLVYATAGSIGAIRAGALLLGSAGGGQTDLMPYVASRYFGTRLTSTVFGLLLLGFFAGAAAGPALFVLASTAVGIVGALFALAALQVLPAAIFATLRDYPRLEAA